MVHAPITRTASGTVQSWTVRANNEKLEYDIPIHRPKSEPGPPSRTIADPLPLLQDLFQTQMNHQEHRKQWPDHLYSFFVLRQRGSSSIQRVRAIFSIQLQLHSRQKTKRLIFTRNSTTVESPKHFQTMPSHKSIH